MNKSNKQAISICGRDETQNFKQQYNSLCLSVRVQIGVFWQVSMRSTYIVFEGAMLNIKNYQL